MNSCWLQSSTQHNEKFPVGSYHTPTLSDSRRPRPDPELRSSPSWKYQTFSEKHLGRRVVPLVVSRSAWWANILEPKNILCETNRKHFGGNLGNYRAIWSSGSSQVLTLNGIFRSCFYNELFEPDNKLILIFVLLKNFGQIFNFLSCGTKSYRRKYSI